jgi:cytoskeletal protein CcmA (bactofilin family)
MVVSILTRMIKSNQGSSMPLVLLIMVILVIFSVTALSLGSASVKNADNQEKKLQAYYLARSGTIAVASYIVENPDGLTDSQMNSFVNKLLAAGTSEAFQLDASDRGEIVVTIEQPSDKKLVVQSTASIDAISQTVSLEILIENYTSDKKFSKAIFSNGNIFMTGGTTVTGDMAAISDDASVSISGGSTVDGVIYISPDTDPSKVTSSVPVEVVHLETIPDFPKPYFPKFPEPPAISHTGTSLIVDWSGDKTISESIHYSENITANNNTLFIRADSPMKVRAGSLTVGGGACMQIDANHGLDLFIDNNMVLSGDNVININTDHDINIITPKFSYTYGQWEINRTPGKKGRVNLYVTENLGIVGGSNINYVEGQEALATLLNIYYAGKNQYSDNIRLTLENGTSLAASLYIENDDLQISGGHHFYGRIISGGENISINGGSGIIVELLYAPEAVADLTGGVQINGSIVADSISISGGSNIVYKELDVDVDDFTEEISDDKITYKYGNWF